MQTLVTDTPIVLDRSTFFLDRAYAPILKWAGSKTWAAPLLKSLYIQHDRYVYLEPMCGGLGSAIGVGARYVWLGDLNPDLINLYYQITGGLEIKDFGQTPEDFYNVRDRFNSDTIVDLRTRAQMMYYLNRRCFRGLYRTNRQGKFNSPVGEPKQQVCTTNRLELPKNWTFSHADYRTFYDLVAVVDGFMVVDPPYDATGVAYGSSAFDVDDVVDRIPQHLGVVYFNSDTSRVRAALQRNGFDTFHISEPRSMNAGKGACKQTILIAVRGIDGAKSILKSFSCEEID